MTRDLLITKLVVPEPRTDYVPRHRLTQRIANPKRGRVTLITAPAGYGKTTVLAEWCESKRTRIGWVALDAPDNDPALFWRYVAAALGAEQSPFETGGGTGLLNALAAGREMMTLVLDDLHVIEAKEILNELGEFIEHAPHTLTFVLASRTVPDLPLARWRARGQLDEIEMRQLAFTRHEVRGFLERTMQLDVTPETAGRLEKMTEGWAAALQLAALAMQTDAAVVKGETGQKHVFEYLAAEVFAKQSKARQRFLVETSFLERMNAGLLNKVLERKDSAAMLKKLARANLFVEAADAEGMWYRYHPLFAEFLQTRLKEGGSGRERTLRRRAGKWFAERQLWGEAIQHALVAQDYGAASDWIDHGCERAMEHGQIATMLGWLDALPREVVAATPGLELWYGWVMCLEERFEEMNAHVRQAERRAAALARTSAYWKCEVKMVRGKAAAVRAQAAVRQGDEDGVFEWSARALKELPIELRNERSVAWATRAGAYVRSGRLEEAARAYEEAERESRVAQHPFIHISVVLAEARVLVQMGEMARAQELLKRGMEFARAENAEQMMEPMRELLKELARGSNGTGRGEMNGREELSKREREILGWVARGESNPQIAARLEIGTGTVNWHTKNIYKKLGARNGTEAAARARDFGLV